MKAIARFALLLLLICGTTLAWRSSERRFRAFSEDANRQKAEGEILQDALRPLHSTRLSSKIEPAWSRTEFQTKLEDAFQKNDPCAVLDLLRNTKDASPREYWSSGMAVLLSQSSERAALLEELLANPQSPMYGIPSEGSKRLETRFLNALLLSGQLKGLDETPDSPRRGGPRNAEKAIEIFKELATEDPENGAYSFFLGSVLREKGAVKEEVRAAFNQASKTARFDPFYQGIFDSLQTVAYSNAATFTWVYSFLESMPMPDYEIGIRYLKNWAHSEEPGKWIAHRFAKRLADLGAAYKSKSPGYQFSRSEYMLGQNLKFTVEGRMEKSWEEYMNKMREAHKFISETPKSVEDAEIVLYGERIDNKRSCGPDAWKMLYSAYKAKKDKES